MVVRVKQAVPYELIAALRARFGERCSTALSVREQHGNITTWLPNEPPDAVVFARSEAEVQQVVRLAGAHRVPVIAFGTGSSLEGHVNAPYGGICIDLSGMNQIIAVHPQDLDCVVEPGVTRKALNDYLRSYGLFFPIDPGADASIGGMAATRASGTNAVRYGTMKDNVLAIDAVMANGEVMRTARRAKKTSAGYDLTRLLVGSEGTLGIATKLTLKLSGLPEAISGGVCPFPSIKAAADAVIHTIQSVIPVARIEIMDEAQVRAVNAYSKLNLPEKPLLFLEFHGSDAGVAEQAERFGEIAAELGGGPFDWTARPEERTKLWAARHDVYWSVKALKPGCEALATDVCVPISALADCISQTKADIEATGLLAPIVGHVGDGNFHVSVVVDRANAAEVGAVEGFLHRLVERAHAFDGTCTGEHGIGQGKKKYLATELGGEAVSAMRAIKLALDPDNILNPGKIFDT